LNFRKRPKKPVVKTPQKKTVVEKPRTKRGAENTGAGGGKEFGTLLNRDRPIRSAKALIDVIEEEYPQLLSKASRSPAGQQTKQRIARQRINFKRIKKAAISGHANAQYHLAKLLLRGQGAEQNFDAEQEWIQEAADRGYAKAQLLLGYLALKPERSRDLAQADAMFWVAAQ
jgi:TPR repeat protein